MTIGLGGFFSLDGSGRTRYDYCLPGFVMCYGTGGC